MHVKSLLFVFLMLSACCSVAQTLDYNQRPDFLKANSVWAWGLKAGADFNSGVPTPIATASLSDEGCASVADPVSGKLLFYSNGGEVYNANHQVMPNGDSLFGNPKYPIPKKDPHLNYSSAQGVCIVPVIDDPGKYYLFSLKGLTSRESTRYGSLFYSVIDMTLNNGLGDIVAGKKNIVLDTQNLSEAMIAIPGNNCDIWLMVHKESENAYKAYRITKEGITTTPVISEFIWPAMFQYNVGTMAVSPDREKIAISCVVNGGAEIGKFDANTGKVTDILSVYVGSTNLLANPYSICFSPDNSRLYLAEVGMGIFQLNLTHYNADSIRKSRTAVRTPGMIPTLRLYNDTIYVSVMDQSNIDRINRPNELGTACDYQPGIFTLPAGSISKSSLGNDVVFPLVSDTLYQTTVSSCSPALEVVLDAPAGYRAYQWDDGSTAAKRTVSSKGVYWVMSKDFCLPRIDTFTVEGLDFQKPDITINVQELGTTTPYDSYQWLYDNKIIPGATESKYHVTENGDYRVIVSQQDCMDTSDIYKVTNAGGTNVHTVAASAKEIRIYPNPASDVIHIDAPGHSEVLIYSVEGRLIKRTPALPLVNIAALSTGVYYIKVTDSRGNLLIAEKLIK